MRHSAPSTTLYLQVSDVKSKSTWRCWTESSRNKAKPLRCEMPTSALASSGYEPAAGDGVGSTQQDTGTSAKTSSQSSVPKPTSVGGKCCPRDSSPRPSSPRHHQCRPRKADVFILLFFPFFLVVLFTDTMTTFLVCSLRNCTSKPASESRGCSLDLTFLYCGRRSPGAVAHRNLYYHLRSRPIHA